MTYSVDELLANGAKTAVVTMARGDYAGALFGYRTLQEWSLTSGLCFDERISGKILSPQFQGKPVESGIIPPELMDQPEWTAASVIHCLDGESARRVGALPLPPGATLAWKEITFGL